MNDLLAPEGARLAIHESREAGVYVAGLREEIVTSCEHVLSLLEAGERSRHTGETRMNKASSRSHSVFRMVRPAVHGGLVHACSAAAACNAVEKAQNGWSSGRAGSLWLTVMHCRARSR